ncbi:SDR family NAD(P)-dependent oxidoreductase [Aquincola sp. MAHUQ-54]|uniref:SDR family NAD(P)-dependent oxidoreductase n=1 Tax=Aquincola agrisoli TaxID=3119538 RepID=A0AAW9QCK5_9BURK
MADVPHDPTAAAGAPSMRTLLQDATLQIRRLRARVQTLESQAKAAAAQQGVDEPIAIVGMACRFPGGADTPEAFWRLLDGGIDAVSEVPPRAWDAARWHDPSGDHAGMVTRHGAFLSDDEVQGFDPQCFGITPRDAERMDPQQRLLLEVAHEAMENAGLAPFAQKGTQGGHATGVIVGTGFDDYARRHVASGDPTRIDAAGALGTHRAIAAGRVAYVFGLQGPTLQLDTTCSSSLLAVHLACQALRSREAERMIAGGVNLMLAPEPSVGFSRLGALSADGRCRTFDADAGGYARGEGCGLVVLERLADAQAAGRPVLAVLRGSAVNHDGASNGLTAPSGPAQVAVIRAALARAGLTPSDVQYVEAHGTATPLGDPIELLALQEAYAGTERAAPLWVGSVKTNIGHLEAAAGVAGLIKAVLSLHHGRLPAHLHLRTPSPRVPWERLALRVPRASTAWPDTEGPRRAGVSSFGMSGTNVHVVVEAAPPAAAPAAGDAPASRVQLFPIAARHAAALQAQAASLARWLEAPKPGLSPDALAHALGQTRSHGPFRRAFVAGSVDTLRASLAAAATAPAERRAAPRVAFLFTGQGAQQRQMGRTLYRDWPVFRAAFDRCAALADARLPRPLAEVMWPDEEAGDADLDRTGYAQPALFALQVALAALWRSWGVVPHCVLGHSVGEYAAAVAAGVMAMPDAMNLLLSRASRMQALPAGGAMAALQAAPSVVAALLPAGAEIAARNGPAHTVVAGTQAAVAQAVAVASAQGIGAQRLKVSHAFHSALMAPMLDGFAGDVAAVPMAAPRIAMVSSRSGRLAGADIAQPGYWVAQVREPVAFDAALATLAEQGCEVAIEIGPRPVLLGLLAASAGAAGAAAAAPLMLPSLRGTPMGDETTVLLGSVAQLYEAGAALDWSALSPRPLGTPPASLPKSVFVRRPCWVDAPPAPARPAEGRLSASALAPSASRWPGREVPLAGDALKVFERDLAADAELPWHHHRVAGRTLLPAAASVCAVLATAARTATGAWRIEALSLEQGLWLPEEGAVPVQVHWQPDGEAGVRWSLHSRGGAGSLAGWQRHVQARLKPADTGAAWPAGDVGAQWAGLPRRLSSDGLYRRLADHGLVYGPRFQALAEVAWGDAVAIGRVRHDDAPADPASDEAAWDDASVAAAWIDAGLQLAGAAVAGEQGAEAQTGAAARLWLPAAIAAFEARRGTPAWVVAQRLTPAGDASPRIDLRWHAADGRCVARLHGLRLAALSLPAAQAEAPSPAATASVPIRIVEPTWQAEPLPAAARWPAPAVLATRLRPAFEAALQSADCAAYEALQPGLEALSLAWAARAIDQLGGPDALATPERAAQRGVSAPERQALLAALLRSLAAARQRGPAAAGGDVALAGSLAAGTPEGLDAPALQAELEALHPGRPELALVGRCGAALADILTGRADALAVLFPGGDLSLLTALYERSPGAQVMNGLLRASLQAAVAALPPAAAPDAPLRVLEIGAGTGGSTAHLLPVLAGLARAGRPVDYLFTDVSPHFLQQARERFAAHGFLRFGLLDIESAQAAAGAETGFDLVVAANVLHATEDLGRTLRHVADRLAPHGLLLLLEATTPLQWLDLVFGTLPGWWRFTDRALRADHPLLPAEAWCRALQSAGFAAAVPVAGARALPQTVLLAQRAAAQACRIVEAGSTAGAAALQTALAVQGIASHVVVGEAAFAPPVQPVDTVALLLPALVETQADALPAQCTAAVDAVAGQVRALLAQLPQWPRAPRLVLLEGAADQPVHASEPTAAGALRSAALWGLVQTLQFEHPELQCTLLQVATPADAASALLYATADRHVRMLNGQRQVARLRPVDVAITQANEGSTPQRLEGDGVSIASLSWRPFTPRALGAGDVRVRICAAGLNFRDVLIAIGQYPHADPAQPDRLGAECVGEVIACGTDVHDLPVGTRVMALAADGFATEAVLPRALVVPVPDAAALADDAAAATLPVAFATAYHGLVHCAGLRRGERVLIHAGTGGVGQAAIQIAQSLGAEVFATASRAKWPALQALGVQHVMDSRSTGFAAEIAACTGGAGVHVVLNPLPGAMQRESLAALAADGRFVEIGKGGGLDDAGFAAVAPGVRLHRVDLAALSRSAPAHVQSLLTTLAAEVRAGRWRPLPVQVFAPADAAAALRTLQQARHLGKLVLQPPGDAEAPSRVTVRADGCTLITGGLGGLGLQVAQWLVAQGARELVLAGRHAEPDEATAAQLDALRAQGARVHLRAVDVSDRAGLAALLAGIGGGGPITGPLRGVVHAAGVLDDAPIEQQHPERLARVLAPKLAGGWHLHSLTAALPLDFFVLFGSAAGLLGAPGQANHAAANAFLDGLARWRRAQGLPALSLAWGAWSQVGSALRYRRDGSVADTAGRAGQVSGLPGVGWIDPGEGLQWLGRLWHAPQPVLGVLPIDWRQLSAHPALRGAPMWSPLVAGSSAGDAAGAPADAVAAQAAATPAGALRGRVLALPASERAAALDDALCTLIAQTLGFGVAELDRQAGFFDLGLDSLSALELKNRLQHELGLALPSTLAFDHPTPAALVAHLASRLQAQAEEAGPASAAAAPKPAAATGESGPAAPDQPATALADQLDARLDALDRLLDEAPLG